LIDQRIGTVPNIRTRVKLCAVCSLLRYRTKCSYKNNTQNGEIGIDTKGK
jgi:hypothetical protein